VALSVVALAAAAMLPAMAPAAGHGGEPSSATFGARSYRPGDLAVLRIASGAGHAWLQLFLVGGHEAPAAQGAAWDRPTTGEAMTTPRLLTRPGGGRAWVVHIPVRWSWPSGVYVARLRLAGATRYAPFVLRPRRLGAAPVLVVEPTNTWQAYNFESGDSWYLDPAVHAIDLARPYSGDGLPSQFVGLGLGFLRWYWRSGFQADFVSDDDLENGPGIRLLRRYRLVVFASHEEYVTGGVYDLIERYRDEGGNLAFLSADSFFYRVSVSGDTMLGRERWRDLGRPEASLIGAEYVGWDEARFPNRPFHVVDESAAPWLFAHTGLGEGSRFGRYGIEIDQRTADSPAGTRVLAEIPGAFGPGMSAEMTIYRRGRATVFDAGAMNFGASANWPGVSAVMTNLWSHLSGERVPPPS
jgi:hypothetical protein